MCQSTDALHTLIDNACLNQDRPSRDYMGASGLGVECQRSLWYSFHKPMPIDKAQTLRKFDVGNALEPVVIKWLQDAGIKFFTPPNGKQFSFKDGLLGGSCDGVIYNIPGDTEEPYLLEIKTSNGFYFKEFQKKGISANDKYAGQVQVYMNKFKLKKSLFAVVNKDTQELFLQIIKYDEFEALRLIERGHQTASMENEPDRSYSTKMDYRCKVCSYYKMCWS